MIRAGTIVARFESAASNEPVVPESGRTTCTRGAPFTTWAFVTIYPLFDYETRPDGPLPANDRACAPAVSFLQGTVPCHEDLYHAG